MFSLFPASKEPNYRPKLTLKTAIFSVSIKVPLLSLVATETDELKREETFRFARQIQQNSLFHNVGQNPERHSRHNLSVIDQILQRVSAGEVVVEVRRVADESLVGPGRVDVPGDDDRLDSQEAAERPGGVRHFIHNLNKREQKYRCL